jgi:hypothetical protein
VDISVIDLALSASLDPHISTKAIRITLGLHQEISRALAKPNRDGPRTEAFVAHEYLEHLTGMNIRTIVKAAALAEKEIGLVVRSSDGEKDRLMEGTNHGRAAGWALAEPHSFPALAVPSGYAAAEFLDPANSLWSKNDRGYRTALVLVATHGMNRILTTSASVAALMGLTLPNATKHLDALVKARVGSKTGRGQWSFFFDVMSGFGDNRLKHETADRATARRKTWRDRLAPESDDPIPDEPEPVLDPQEALHIRKETQVSTNSWSSQIEDIPKRQDMEARRSEEQKPAVDKAEIVALLGKISENNEVFRQRDRLSMLRGEPKNPATAKTPRDTSQEPVVWHMINIE